MANVPGSRSMPHRATEAPQATSPSQPGDAVAIAHWGAACLMELLLGRRLPLDSPFYVGCGYKGKWYTNHQGIDFYCTPNDVPVKRSCGFQGIGVSGANVYPAFPGCSHQATPDKAKVVYAQLAGGTVGNCVILEHTDNTHQIWIRTIYMHLATIAVSVGDFVSTSDTIGTVGYTGGYKSTNAHLHFEVNEQRPANFYWRVAGELALMPDRVVKPRSAIDPEIYLPDVAGGELLHVAAVPPPAQVPAGPPPAYRGLLNPIWMTYQHPFSGEDRTYRVLDTDDDGNPRWYMKARITSPGTVSVKPVCGGPDGKIYVAGVWAGLVGTKRVTLLHLDVHYRVMIMSEYENISAASLAVAKGDWITVDTVLGNTTIQNTDLYVHLFRREAASANQWVSGEPFTWDNRLLADSANYAYWADPACCLPEPDTFYATADSPAWTTGRDCASEPGWA